LAGADSAPIHTSLSCLLKGNPMKILSTVLLTLMMTFSFALQAKAQITFPLSSEIFDGNSVKFIPHKGPGIYDSYLTMNLPFKPMKQFMEQFQPQPSTALKSRGEAHITVVTPLEYWYELKPYNVTIHQLNQLAQKMKIQKSSFTVQCMGRGEAQIDGQNQQTYFVVVQSEDLLRIRHAIQALVRKSDNGLSKFDADTFYSHITLGYTERDLHEADGVLKDCAHSQFADIEIAP